MYGQVKHGKKMFSKVGLLAFNLLIRCWSVTHVAFFFLLQNSHVCSDLKEQWSAAITMFSVPQSLQKRFGKTPNTATQLGIFSNDPRIIVWLSTLEPHHFSGEAINIATYGSSNRFQFVIPINMPDFVWSCWVICSSDKSASGAILCSSFVFKHNTSCPLTIREYFCLAWSLHFLRKSCLHSSNWSVVGIPGQVCIL